MAISHGYGEVYISVALSHRTEGGKGTEEEEKEEEEEENEVGRRNRRRTTEEKGIGATPWMLARTTEKLKMHHIYNDIETKEGEEEKWGR